MSGAIDPTDDINSSLMRHYYGVEGNDNRVLIMSIEKSTAKVAELQSAIQDPKQVHPAEAVPNAAIRGLSLEFEDDNFGEDPYNRTGQFCRLALKDRE